MINKDKNFDSKNDWIKESCYKCELSKMIIMYGWKIQNFENYFCKKSRLSQNKVTINYNQQKLKLW